MALRLLVVDDHPLIRRIFIELLERRGHTAIGAENGKKAFDMIKSGVKIDGILMDIDMPVMSGLDATRAIRNLPEGKSVPIIGISADYEATQRLCAGAGMNFVVGKALDPLEIELKIAQASAKPPEVGWGAVVPKEKTTPLKVHAVFDYEKALREFQDDRDLLNSVTLEFADELMLELGILRERFEVKDYEALKKESHKVKGGALNLCALNLADAAREIETQALSKDDNHLAELLNDFDRAVENFRRAAVLAVKRQIPD